MLNLFLFCGFLTKDDVSLGLSRIEVITFGFDADHLFLCLVDTERLADLSQVRSRSCFYIQSMDQTGLERWRARLELSWGQDGLSDSLSSKRIGLLPGTLDPVWTVDDHLAYTRTWLLVSQSQDVDRSLWWLPQVVSAGFTLETSSKIIHEPNHCGVLDPMQVWFYRRILDGNRAIRYRIFLSEHAQMHTMNGRWHRRIWFRLSPRRIGRSRFLRTSRGIPFVRVSESWIVSFYYPTW